MRWTDETKMEDRKWKLWIIRETTYDKKHMTLSADIVEAVLLYGYQWKWANSVYWWCDWSTLHGANRLRPKAICKSNQEFLKANKWDILQRQVSQPDLNSQEQVSQLLKPNWRQKVHKQAATEDGWSNSQAEQGFHPSIKNQSLHLKWC